MDPDPGCPKTCGSGFGTLGVCVPTRDYKCKTKFAELARAFRIRIRRFRHFVGLLDPDMFLFARNGIRSLHSNYFVLTAIEINHY
jgi:hypothetical protein